MLLFEDIFTGKGVLTDSYKMKLVDDFVYVVEATYVTNKGDNFGDDMFGGNPSAEETIEDLEEGKSVSGFDCVLNHSETVEEFAQEPEYKSFVKTVLPSVVKAAKGKLDTESHAIFKKKFSHFFTKGDGGKEKFKNFQIFFSKDAINEESGDLIAAPILVDADDTGMKAKVYYFKHLLKEIKQ